MPVLPFSSFGALVMARPENEPNGGSSQIFFFLFEPELTPAGRNLLDGSYAVFGYLTKGQEVLDKLKAGDKIGFRASIANLESYQYTLTIDGVVRVLQSGSQTFPVTTNIVLDYTIE